jgi:hypothetical protein
MIRAHPAIVLAASLSLGSAAPTASAEPIAAINFMTGPVGVYQLVLFDSADPTKLLSVAPITGLQFGEMPLGIDVRPATGELYLIAEQGIYTLDFGGVATRLTGGTPFVIGDDPVIDFEPTTDRIRLLTRRENLLLNPNAGSAGLASSHLPPTDPAQQFGPELTGLGYTNSSPGATSTLLYAIDQSNLVTVNPADAGTVNTISALAAGDPTPSAFRGFDISPTTGTAYLAGTIVSMGEVHDALFTLDLSTGIATRLGPEVALDIQDIAVVPEPGAATLLLVGTALTVRRRHRGVNPWMTRG